MQACNMTTSGKVLKNYKVYFVVMLVAISFIIFAMEGNIIKTKLGPVSKEPDSGIIDEVDHCKNYQPPDRYYIENEYWQVLETSNGTFKMLNAYFDARSYFKSEPVIRIIALINRVDPEVKTYCQLFYEGVKDPAVVEVFEYRLMWFKGWGQNQKGSQPYQVGCKNPLKLVPRSVSLVEHQCDKATNNLKVIYNLPTSGRQKDSFAVCVKGMKFMDDQSMLLIEWIETLSILGVKKVFFYVIKCHPEMMRTLNYYEAKGKLQIEMITEPKGSDRNESLTQWLQNEMIPINDCLYKHMYEYEFLVPIDIDEIIMPVMSDDMTWQDLLVRVKSKETESLSSYIFQNVFFLTDNIHANETQPEVPSNMRFLQHVYRAAQFSKDGAASKGFHDTEQVITLHNHWAVHCVGVENCPNTMVDQSDGRVQHYRRGCENYPPEECEDFKQNVVKDKALWKYKDEIIANVQSTIEALKFFKN